MGKWDWGGFDMNFFQVNIPTTFSSFMSLAGKKSMVHVLSGMPVMGILCLILYHRYSQYSLQVWLSLFQTWLHVHRATNVMNVVAHSKFCPPSSSSGSIVSVYLILFTVWKLL